MFSLIKKRLGNEILAVIIITIVFVLGVEIVVRLYYGTKDRTEIMEMYASELASSIHSSFKYPCLWETQTALQDSYREYGKR